MNVDDPALLLGTQPLLWLNDPDVWEQYVQHWCKEEQRALGVQARKNRLSSKRPDGKPSTHSLGSKGIHERLLEEEEKTGKPASALPLLLDMNKKKDKATAEPTGETYNQNFQDDDPGTSQSAITPSSVVHSLEVNNSELEHDLLEMKTNNAELKEEVAGLRADLGRLTNMMQAFMAGSAAAAAGSAAAAAGVQFTMPPVAPTVTASSLLASMHQHPPPAVAAAAAVSVVAATTDVQPPPPADPTQHDS